MIFEPKVTRKLIIRKEIQAPKKLIIGDHMYLEKGLGEKLTCVWNNLSFADTVRAEIAVFEEAFGEFKTNVVRLYVMPEPELEEMHMAETLYESIMIYPELLAEDLINLACDTARYSIETDKGSVEINTGMDGYYGIAALYKDGFGLLVELRVDADEADFNDVLSVF